MSKILTTWVCLCASLNFVNGQDLKGEWVLIQVPNTFGLSNNITRITNDSIYDYAFDKLREKSHIRFIAPNTIVIRDTVHMEFEFSGNDRIRVKTINNEPENELNFVRLLPTQDPNNCIPSLKSANMNMKLKHETLTLPLGKKLDIDQAFISDSALIAADSVCIEKRENTYFLNFFSGGYRTSMFPIKEVNRNGLVLYGLPSHEGVVYAKKVE